MAAALDTIEDDEEGESTLVASRAELGDVRALRPVARPFLLVAGGKDSVGRTFKVERTTVVGRGEVDFSLDEEGLSRRHARFDVDTRGQVTIEDLGSTNGTFVNGERIVGRRALRDGDRIEIGTATILKLAFHDELQEAIQRRLYEQATRDGLTGAYNKRAFGDAMAKELAFAARHRRPLALVLFDGDHFKRVNDGFGHAAGDYVLSTLVKVTSAALRKEDVLARWGGEEFAVLLRDTGLVAAQACAERLRVAVERQAFVHQGRTIPVTISLGVVATVPSKATTAQQLFELADQCLYGAKEQGRNRVVAAEHAIGE